MALYKFRIIIITFILAMCYLFKWAQLTKTVHTAQLGL